ncbi:haloacid dehalogenase type II [Ferrovibrio terrae]|uniref:(S)-2-haloacid dehalogenase n=1 Tax=Ferrovibrio terrae TaxID=2594003 RepID=A0A516H508_9PROT|nr:haloacid dehalogenase type II [Ferrovibrio terrae]QDO98879.1 haloacid dehalogenase type II [Ferrovibrio terrae]
MTRAEGIKACLFDAYGTLFDVNFAARALADELGPHWQPLAETWRAKQLNYSWLRSLMGAHVDFRQVTADALDFALEDRGLQDAGLRQRLLDLYLNLACYPEVPAMLQQLKDAGFVTGILSNGAPAMLEAACRSAGIDTLIDHLISVEDVGIYKPDPRIYRLAMEKLVLPAHAIAFHSSNGWDIHAGKRAGFYAIWINRSGQPAERLPNPPDVVLRGLAEVPGILGPAA